jgi:hypothetical protein
VCRESAAVTTLPMERDALLVVADDLRKAIEAREPARQTKA